MPNTTFQPHGSYLTQSLEHATVSDAMHPGILSCEPDASLTEVAKMMATHHVHCGQTADHREAAKAFVEKREPVFHGR